MTATTTPRAFDGSATRRPPTAPGGRARPRRPRLGAWLLRLVRHRAGTQWRLLAVAGVVALVVATLVAALALVLHATDVRGVPAALTEDPDGAVVPITISSLDTTVSEVADAVDTALTDVLRAPVDVEVQATTDLFGVPRAPGLIDALTYIDRRDGVEDVATMVEGEWPGVWTGGDAPVPVAVPLVGARMLGIELGDTITLRDRLGDSDVVVRVAGLYDVAYPQREVWGRDRLQGRGYLPNFVVPGSGGFLTTEAFGPLVVAPETADAGAFEVIRMVVRATPDLSGVTAPDLPGLRARTYDLQEELGYRLDGVAGQLDAGGPLPFLLRDVATGVVVTRAGVAVAAVLLLLVAFSALLQTARLVADARSAEHDLMRARGASRAHLVAALVAETGVLGVVVAVAGPVLAPLLLRVLGGPLAEGQPDDLLAAVRAMPWTAWAAGGVVAAMLVVATLIPLLGAPATFVEGQQARGRAAWAGSLARLALDAVVVALAVGAWTQLRAYGGLLVGTRSRLEVDPVLVVGPALLLLAAVLVGVRVLTLAMRLAERWAARGRGVVLALAGWEVGRRPRQAATAVLLLAVALASATFALTQSSTWEQSQRDQAAFAVGAPAVVEDTGTPGTDAGVLASDGAEPQPVARLSARVAATTATLPSSSAGFTGVTSRILAATGPARATLDRDRVGLEGGAAVAALPAPAGTPGGVDLGERLLGIAATIEITGGELPDGPALLLRAVLEDGAGALSTVDLGLHRLEEGSVEVAGLLPDVRLPTGETPQDSADQLAAETALRAYPIRVVGLQAIVLDQGVAPGFPGTRFDAQATLVDVAALRPAEDVEAVDPEDWLVMPWLDGSKVGIARDPVQVPDEQWSPVGLGLGRDPIDPVDGPLWVRVAGIAEELWGDPVIGATVAWEPVTRLPAVVSTALGERLGDDPDTFAMKVEGFVLGGVVDQVVERVPTLTEDLAMAVDQTALARALVQVGSDVELVDEWWVDVPDAEAWVAAVPPDVAGRQVADRTMTLVGATDDLLEHPLRAATPLVLQLLALGGALVATVGFAVHITVSVRGRGLELAQLRAVGLTRGRLTVVLGLEVAVLAVLGVGLGVGAGTGVAAQVARLLVTGADGAEPIPPVLLVPAQGLGWVAAGVAVLVVVLATGIAAAQRAADPAALLRAGESR